MDDVDEVDVDDDVDVDVDAALLLLLASAAGPLSQPLLRLRTRSVGADVDVASVAS